MQAGPDEASWRGQSVTEFSPEESPGSEWQIINDGVMGGLSQGNAEFTDEGTMKFSGTLSLENNGGFSLIQMGTVQLNLSNDLGLLLRVKGDGRTYEARLESDALYRGRPVSFSGKFETTAGEWAQVKIPFDSFRGGWRGVDLPEEKLNPADIRRVGIILADKQEGPFEVEIDWIRTYGKGQGSFTKANPDKPAEKTRLIATMERDGRFTTLKTALDAAGLTTFFQWDNPLTVFAPTDEAFGKLPEGVLEGLLKPENKKNLISVLSHHVSTGAVPAKQAIESGSVNTIEGSPLSVSSSGKVVKINDASVIEADIEAIDGIIHVVDMVLLPTGN